MAEDDRTTTDQPAQSAGVSPDAARPAAAYHRLEDRAFLLGLALVSLLFLYLLKPFFSAIFWACIIGVLFYPMQERLVRQWGRPNGAALVTLTACVLILIAPTLFILGAFYREATDLYNAIQSGEIDPGSFIDRIKQGFPAVQRVLDYADLDLAALKERLSSVAVGASRLVAQNAVQVGQNTLRFFISLAVMLYVAFFMLRDGPRLVALMIRALPLGDERERLLFGKFAEVSRATIKGNVVIAAIQGTLGGLIFWVLGIPGALLWGVVMAVISLIPMLGAGLIWGPVAIYLFAIGDWVQGLVLVVFGVTVIGLVDNFLRPILVGRDTKLPDFIVLLSTLGGLVLFGINGFVIGPLIAVLFVAFWQIFIAQFNVEQ